MDEDEGVASMVVPAEPPPPQTSSVDDGDGDGESESESEDEEDAPVEELVGLFELEVRLESGLEVVPLVGSAENEDERVVTSDESDWDVVELPAEASVVTVEFERVEELDNKDDEEEVNEALWMSAECREGIILREGLLTDGGVEGGTKRRKG